MRPKILIIAASLRAGSHNARLAALAAKELTLAEADVTRISLADYALPIFDADLMADSGLPLPAIELKRMLTAHRGVFIATPEYNNSPPPLFPIFGGKTSSLTSPRFAFTVCANFSAAATLVSADSPERLRASSCSSTPTSPPSAVWAERQ